MLREKQRLRIRENKMLMVIFLYKESYSLYYSYIVSVIK
jgi:hypothetical protein